MWRCCDLHNHTGPNEQDGSEFDAGLFVRACLEQGLDVVAVTNHDHADNVALAQEAGASAGLDVIAGVEVSTNHGHVLVLAPGHDGLDAVLDLIHRVSIREHNVTDYDELVRVVATDLDRRGVPYSEGLVLLGAHVDQPGSMLATDQPLGVDGQLKNARKMQALEVVSVAVRDEWLTSGVKQRETDHTLVQGSDSHVASARVDRHTWLYLPELDARSLRHALATPEASVRFDGPAVPPANAILSVSFDGGLLDGHTFEFGERVNAIVGPPSSGKSLILDAIRFVLGHECDIAEIRRNTDARLSRCLPSGSIIRVRVRSDGLVTELPRAIGGAAAPSPPFRPIVFSQTELVRRAMEASPSMALLDIHCSQGAQLKLRLNVQAAAIGTAFEALLNRAEEARVLAREVRNPVDGLAATTQAITELAGSEAIAKQANDAARVSQWRQTVELNAGRLACGPRPDQCSGHTGTPCPRLPRH